MMPPDKKREPGAALDSRNNLPRQGSIDVSLDQRPLCPMACSPSNCSTPQCPLLVSP